MKTPLFALTLAGLLSLGSLYGIPDRVGFIGDNDFLARNGVNLEDHALNPDTWANDQLKGSWKPEETESGASTQTFVLEPSAVVFGVPANRVRALKHGEVLDSFEIRFQIDGERVPGRAELLAVLRKNIEAYTGERPEKGDAASKSCRFVYKAFAITLSSAGPDAAVVSIRRLPA